jgi:hypothetical protein
LTREQTREKHGRERSNGMLMDIKYKKETVVDFPSRPLSFPFCPHSIQSTPSITFILHHTYTLLSLSLSLSQIHCLISHLLLHPNTSFFQVTKLFHSFQNHFYFNLKFSTNNFLFRLLLFCTKFGCFCTCLMTYMFH